MKHLSFAALALCARARWTVAFSAVPTAPAVRELAVAREVLELGEDKAAMRAQLGAATVGRQQSQQALWSAERLWNSLETTLRVEIRDLGTALACFRRDDASAKAEIATLRAALVAAEAELTQSRKISTILGKNVARRDAQITATVAEYERDKLQLGSLARSATKAVATTARKPFSATKALSVAAWTKTKALFKTKTNADWRAACDADGVVSHYDFGLRLADPAPVETPAAAPTAAPAAAKTNAEWRAACDADGVISHFDFGLRM